MTEDWRDKLSLALGDAFDFPLGAIVESKVAATAQRTPYPPAYRMIVVCREARESGGGLELLYHCSGWARNGMAVVPVLVVRECELRLSGPFVLPEPADS